MKNRSVSRRETLRKEAEARNTAYNLLSILDKFCHLDKTLGIGVGAKKQRRRLLLQTQH